jgi:predicted transcriptional regulator of viral defense system
MLKLYNIARPNSLITDTELAFWLDGSPDSRYGKVKRLQQQGKLLHIRRGLYSVADASTPSAMLHPFELAHHIYAPSYISLESALAYYQLIPEAVYVTTSVSIKRSKEFDTPVGKFTYLKLPTKNFYLNVELITTNNHRFLIAKPWKAIFDYVYGYKKDWYNLDPLWKSLRIELDELPTLSEPEIELFDDYYASQRMTRFLRGIRRELK